MDRLRGFGSLDRAMAWNPARQLFSLAFGRPEERVHGPRARVEAGPAELLAARAASICVASGKGGTGKTLLSASLTVPLSRLGRTLLFDADLGAANAHILCDVHPKETLVDVVEGRLEASRVTLRAADNLDLLSGGSGFSKMAGLSSYELQLIALGIEKLEVGYEYLILDSAAGLSRQTVAFAAAADLVVLVTTPDVTAMTDAYAFLKVLWRQRPQGEVLLVVNRTRSEEEARATAQRIRDVSLRFLGRSPRLLGTLPEDRAAFRCTQGRKRVLAAEPDSPLGRALGEVGRTLVGELSRARRKGLGRSLKRRLDWGLGGGGRNPQGGAAVDGACRSPASGPA